MFRPPNYGGLGVNNVKWKALAVLIRTFLETACFSKFNPSMYHSLLYRYHLLDDHSFPNPGFPPFYTPEFFSIIKKVHTESPLNVKQMSEKQWYHLLVEESVTMENINDRTWDYIPSLMELKSPSTDWEKIGDWPGSRGWDLKTQLSC